MQLREQKRDGMEEGKFLWALAAALRAAADVLETEANRVALGRDDPFADWLAKMIKGKFTPRSMLWDLWFDKSIGRNEFYRRVERVLGKPVKRKGIWGWIL